MLLFLQKNCQATAQNCIALTAALPIPGYPGYTISPDGNAWYKGQLKKMIYKPGRSVKLRVKNNGVSRELDLAKLLAEIFLPNPENHTRVNFKDGNHRNCVVENIQWVGHREFVRYHLFPDKSLGIKAKPRPPKSPVPAIPADSSAKEIPGFPGFWLTPQGDFYRGGQLLKPRDTGVKSLCIIIQTQGLKKVFGLAKLIAALFIPNPAGHSRVIFKDRNNRHCTADNIAWSSEKAYNSYLLSFKQASERGTPVEAMDAPAQPIPGYPDHWITPHGEVYAKNLRFTIVAGKGRRAKRVRIRNSEGELVSVALSKLVALSFIPNPDNHPRVIFKDHDLTNCTVDNLQWVSRSDWNLFVSGAVDNAGLLGQKQKPEVWIDPERVELPDFPGHYISPTGRVYCGDRLIRPNCRGGQASVIRIRINDSVRWLGLATLVAQHFVPNPRGCKRIIFKDRNNQHCAASNIAWVDQETYTFYSTAKKGRKKLVIDRHEAIRQCTDEHLKMYYKTLDEYWLHECWKEVEKDIMVANWEEFRSDCYIYFLDRAQRFSILRKPVGLLALHVRGLREKLRKEISPDIPLRQLISTDESLRFIKDYDRG